MFLVCLFGILIILVGILRCADNKETTVLCQISAFVVPQCEPKERVIVSWFRSSLNFYVPSTV